MEWYERMKTKIEVGKKYKNREGVVMTVVEEHPIESNYRERFWVVDETKSSKTKANKKEPTTPYSEWCKKLNDI